MNEKLQNVVVVIADTHFVIPVYILVLSLKHYQPKQRMHILGISLSDEEKALFEQFDNVFVFDSSIARSNTPGAMRVIADILKGEALLSARDCDEPWVALLDGDCIATGDITPYLQPKTPGLYVRERSPAEDNKIFLYYRKPGEEKTGIPESFLKQWESDVHQRNEPARTTTVLSGNLILHRDYLDFSKVWKTFMDRVLVYDRPDQNNVAYYMPAEFALSAWLLFAHEAPPVHKVQLDSNPEAYLAHLGPAPKYWRFWTRKNLIYFDAITALIEEARAKGYAIPVLPYALKKRYKWPIAILAQLHELVQFLWKRAKRLQKHIFGNSLESQARRYGRKI